MTLLRYIKRSTIALTAAIGLLVACDGNDYEGVTVTFAPTLAGEIAEPASGKSVEPVIVTLQTSRVLWEDSQVNIRIEGTGAGYGYSYATEPAMLQPGVLTLTIPAGKNVASFKFQPVNDGIFEPFNYDYTFHIDQTNDLIESVGQADYNLRVIDSTDPFLEYNFEDCSTNLAQLVEQVVDNSEVMQAKSWKCGTVAYNGSKGAISADAYGLGAGTSNSYLVFPAIDGEKYSTVYLSMMVESNFSGAGAIKVVYSTTYTGEGNPEATGVTWTDMTDLNAEMPGTGKKVWAKVDGLIQNIDGGKLYIAIQYKGGQNASASGWVVDDVQIKGN